MTLDQARPEPWQNIYEKELDMSGYEVQWYINPLKSQDPAFEWDKLLVKTNNLTGERDLVSEISIIDAPQQLDADNESIESEKSESSYRERVEDAEQKSLNMIEIGDWDIEERHLPGIEPARTNEVWKELQNQLRVGNCQSVELNVEMLKKGIKEMKKEGNLYDKDVIERWCRGSRWQPRNEIMKLVSMDAP